MSYRLAVTQKALLLYFVRIDHLGEKAHVLISLLRTCSILGSWQFQNARLLKCVYENGF